MKKVFTVLAHFNRVGDTTGDQLNEIPASCSCSITSYKYFIKPLKDNLKGQWNRKRNSLHCTIYINIQKLIKVKTEMLTIGGCGAWWPGGKGIWNACVVGSCSLAAPRTCSGGIVTLIIGGQVRLNAGRMSDEVTTTLGTWFFAMSVKRTRSVLMYGVTDLTDTAKWS